VDGLGVRRAGNPIGYAGLLFVLMGPVFPLMAAVRETSVIFAALIGLIFLRESFGIRRLAASALIAAGIILIAV
jgi:uncharacterized membrane protein